MTAKIRTLIVDDSVFYRGILADIIQKIETVELVGSAGNGHLALSKIALIKPDLITLDVEMPGMDGVAVLKEIRQRFPEVMVVMISSTTKNSARITIEALEEGALDFVAKPDEGNAEANERQLYRQLRRIISIVETRIILRRGSGLSLQSPRQSPRLTGSELSELGNQPGPTVTVGSAKENRVEIVAIGVSTGGPAALPHVLKMLPASFPVPVVIVQHMPSLFVSVLTDSLGRKSNLAVVEATNNMSLKAGTVYLAPGGKQAKIVRGPGTGKPLLMLTDDPPENFCRPSVDYMFRSVANVFGGNVLAVIMTGMGRDGVAGLKMLKDAGATTFAQDASSSVVYGMAMEASKAGVIDRIVTLDSLGENIRLRVGV